MKKAFTLVELLVVIGILAVLMGIMISTLRGTSDSANAAKCLSNLKNLASAVQSYGAEVANYPLAGSVVYQDMVHTTGKAERKYYERKGWINWSSKGKFPGTSKETPPSVPMCTTDDKLAEWALTTGALWKYVNGGKSVFVCPTHARKNSNVRWSYLMNAYFGWAAAENHVHGKGYLGAIYGSVDGAERTLLFAEVPFQGAGDWFPDGSSSSTDNDAILQYKDCKKSPNVQGKNCRDGNEHIGANHKSGRNWYAHVVFCDGHVEKFKATASNGTLLDSNTLRDLTTWLCTGESVTFNGQKYEKFD